MHSKRTHLQLIAVVLLAISLATVSAQTKEGTGGDDQTDVQTQALSSSPLAKANTLKGTFIGKAIVPSPEGPIHYIFTETFHEDGTTESNASIDLVPPAASTARGQYQHLGGNEFAVTTVGTLVNSVTDPTLFGTFKIRQLLTFNRQRDEIMDGRIQVEVFDVNGNLVFSFGAKPDGTAKQVAVEVFQ